MNNKKLAYQSLNPINKEKFLQSFKKSDINGQIELLIQLRESNDIDFAEKIYEENLENKNLEILTTSLYSLGYLSIMKNIKIKSEIFEKIKKLSNTYPNLNEVLEEVIWEIEQNI